MGLLDVLEPEELKTLESHLETVRFPKGTCIFGQGDPGKDCFILDKGKIRIQLNISESEMHVTLGILEPGHILGEFCLLEKGVRSAAAFAEEAVVARKFSRKTFMALCSDHPKLGMTMLTYFSRELIRKTRSTNEKLEEFLSKVLEHYPGLLFVLNADGTIGNHISGRVRDLFGDVQGSNIANVLYSNNQEAIEDFGSVLDIASANSKTCQDFMKDLTDSLIDVDDTSFDLDYYVTSSRDGQVDSMLVLGTDITRQLKEKRKAEEASNEAQLITSTAKDLQGFLAFQKEAKNIIDSLNVDKLKVNSQTIDGLFRAIHTIKGSAASYALYKVVSLAHDLETHLSKVRDLFHKDAKAQIENKEQEEIKQNIKNLAEVFESETTRLFELFQVKGNFIRVNHEQLRDAMEQGYAPDEAFRYLSLPVFQEFIKVLAEKILRRARVALADQGIEKEVRFSVSVTNRKLSHEGRILLENIFSHLLRNAADHGIEESVEREMLGKTSYGNILIEQKENDGELIKLMVRDDGRGIDENAVIEKARKQGIIKDKEALSKQEIYELLFHPGFSTKGTASSISGRGVGLDAVRDFLEKVGGSIVVDSIESEGTTFAIMIPGKVLFYKRGNYEKGDVHK